eukprot:COSAG06_NODE_4481_length_4212_cov_2.219305_3_plen_84_part_00
MEAEGGAAVVYDELTAQRIEQVKQNKIIYNISHKTKRLAKRNETKRNGNFPMFRCNDSACLCAYILTILCIMYNMLYLIFPNE